jgi:hypothetical protein
MVQNLKNALCVALNSGSKKDAMEILEKTNYSVELLKSMPDTKTYTVLQYALDNTQRTRDWENAYKITKYWVEQIENDAEDTPELAIHLLYPLRAVARAFLTIDEKTKFDEFYNTAQDYLWGEGDNGYEKACASVKHIIVLVDSYSTEKQKLMMYILEKLDYAM